MATYFVRHASKLDIDQKTLRALWDARKIGIHFPHGKSGPGNQDCESLDPEDYKGSDRKAMRALQELAKSGGYVCAQYAGVEESMVGEVEANSEPELFRGKWGNRNGIAGREAVLKTLQLSRVQIIKPCDSAAILVGRPRQGTLMRWPNAGAAIENIVEGKSSATGLAGLSTPQQEILCSEFLRLPEAGQLGLPTLAHLLLPVGRTMKDIDIYGMATDGKRIFAQVTFWPFAKAMGKKDRLRPFHGGDSHLVLFCRTDQTIVVDGVIVVSIDDVVSRFGSSPNGAQWLSFAVYTGVVPPANSESHPETAESAAEIGHGSKVI